MDASGNLYFGRATWNPFQVELIRRTTSGAIEPLGTIVDTSAGFINDTDVDMLVGPDGRELFFYHPRVFVPDENDPDNFDGITVRSASIDAVDLTTGYVRTVAQQDALNLTGLAVDTSGNLYFGRVTWNPFQVELLRRTTTGAIESVGTIVDSSAGFINDSDVDFVLGADVDCSSLGAFENSITVQDGGGMRAQFTPSGCTLDEVAQAFGYDHFNWLNMVQAVTAVGTPAEALLPRDISGRHPPVPFADPPPGGWDYLAAQCGKATFPPPNADWYRWYYDEVLGFCGARRLIQNATITTKDRLHFTDHPSTLAGHLVLFRTYLVGVERGRNGDLLLDKLNLPDLAFEWVVACVLLPCGDTFLLSNTDPDAVPEGVSVEFRRFLKPEDLTNDDRETFKSLDIGLAGFKPLVASRDGFIKGADRNRNEGASVRLALQGPMGVGFNRATLGFDADSIGRFLEREGLSRATLRLTVAKNEGHWGRRGQQVDAHPLLVDFVEGNGWSPDVPGFGRGGGADEEGTRGEGPGVTWNCAIDADISNNQRDCEETWKGGAHGPATALPVVHFDHTTGEVEWDVTEDVLNGATAWLIKKATLGRGGNVDYYSIEGALEEGDPNLAPTLILER